MIAEDKAAVTRLLRKVQEAEIARIVRYFRDENGIECIVIKGWAAGRFYPPDRFREMSDVDLCVPPERFEDAQKALKTYESKRYGVDLHEGFRRHDTVRWERLLERCETVRLGETDVKVLCPEDHLRVLCVHWLNDGGEYKERLWDIYYLMENRPASFDWDLCLGQVSEVRRGWVLLTIALARRYLGLNVEGLPFEPQELEVPEWVARVLEREWSSELRLRPLHTCLYEPSVLLRQILKRIPPNPIQAMVECEGRVDARTRVPYQIRSLAGRIFPSIRRVTPALLGR